MVVMPSALQRALIDTVRRTLEADARIASLWLSGSFGKEQDDAWSDVDFLVILPDGAGFEVVGDYARVPSALGDVVHARVLFGRIVTAVTRELGRFDLFFASEGELSGVDPSTVKPLFTRSAARPRGSGPGQPEASKLEANIVEFLRVLALLPVVVGREEYAVGVDGAMLLRRMTIETLLEENGVTQAMRGGMLKLNRFLTPEQRAALEGLPALTATRQSVIAVHGALAGLFLPRASSLAAARGVSWPDDFERAVRAALAQQLELAI